MDLILYNGKILTIDNQIFEAIAIKGDKVFAIGTNDKILSLKTKTTKIINLDKKLVLPGFNDSHLHLYNIGKSLQTINLLGTKSIIEVKNKVFDFIKNNPSLSIIKGRGWNQDYFTDENRFLNKNDLDDITSDKELILLRACGHIATVNSKALAKIDQSKKIVGGYIDYENGIIYENALNLFEVLDTKAEIKSTLQKAMAYANQFGITSVQSDDFGSDYNLILDSYHDLANEDLITTRVYEQCLLPNLENLQDFINKGYYTGYGNDYFKIGPLKLLSDGSLGARTAAISIPYQDDLATQGMLTYDDDTLKQIIDYANLNKMQIAVHAIGDRAMMQVLKIYQKMIKKDNLSRDGIIHCQIMDENIQNIFAVLNIIAYVQPIFIHYDHKIVEKRVGKKLMETSYAFKTLAEKGIKLAFGTDSPIENLNPFANLYCAVTRRDLDGNPLHGWNPQEKINLYDAISFYTINSSYASFDEDKKGILKPGYLADLIVVNDDILSLPLECLLNTKVEYTIVGGKIVYQKS